jgi:hypothetical protein
MTNRLARDLIPEAAHVCGSYPAQILFCGTVRVLEPKKVEDPRENLGRRDRREDVATRKLREEGLPCGINFCPMGLIYFLITAIVEVAATRVPGDG